MRSNGLIFFDCDFSSQIFSLMHNLNMALKIEGIHYSQINKHIQLQELTDTIKKAKLYLRLNQTKK